MLMYATKKDSRLSGSIRGLASLCLGQIPKSSSVCLISRLSTGKVICRIQQSKVCLRDSPVVALNNTFLGRLAVPEGPFLL